MDECSFGAMLALTWSCLPLFIVAYHNWQHILSLSFAHPMMWNHLLCTIDVWWLKNNWIYGKDDGSQYNCLLQNQLCNTTDDHNWISLPNRFWQLCQLIQLNSVNGSEFGKKNRTVPNPKLYYAEINLDILLDNSAPSKQSDFQIYMTEFLLISFKYIEIALLSISINDGSYQTYISWCQVWVLQWAPSRCQQCEEWAWIRGLDSILSSRARRVYNVWTVKMVYSLRHCDRRLQSKIINRTARF